VELAHRQDWSFECAAKVFPLLGALKEYLVETLVLDKNILRDSVHSTYGHANFKRTRTPVL
jgi:hypothetical protein